MSVPNLSPLPPIVNAAPPVQQQPASPASAPLPAPVMVQKNEDDTGESSGKGLKRDRPQDNANDAPETSTEPVVKKRREVVTEASSSNFAALIEAGDLDAAIAMLERAPHLLDAENPSSKNKLTPLCLAASLGKADFVTWLIKMNAKVDAPAGNGSTALMFAAENDCTSILEQLISHGANVNAVNPHSGNTAVSFAAIASRKNALSVLLGNGASADLANNKGITPLMRAFQSGDLEVAKFLWQSGASLSARSNSGYTVLNLAIVKNDLPVVRWLIGQGVAIDEADNKGHTPLIQACLLGRLEIAQLLRQHQANLSSRDIYGWTPFHWAVGQGNTGVVSWLLGQGVAIDEADNKGHTPLMQACILGHLEIAQLLSQSGASLSARSNSGWTPLTAAIKQNQLPVFSWLLGQGVAVDEADNEGHTPLMWACQLGRLEIAQLLRQHQANPSSRDIYGWTPLHWAVGQGNTGVVSWLLGQGVAVDEADNKGHTPLMQACLLGDLEVAKLLWQSGASLSIRTNQDETPLILAAQVNQPAVISWLLTQGVNIEQTNNYGRTALTMACTGGYVEVAKLLLESGANIKFTLPDGRDRGVITLQEVAEYQHYAVLALLLETARFSLDDLSYVIKNLKQSDTVAKDMIKYFSLIEGGSNGISTEFVEAKSDASRRELVNNYIKFLYEMHSNKIEFRYESDIVSQRSAAELLASHQLTAMLNPTLCNVVSVSQAIAGTGNKINEAHLLTVLAEMLGSLQQSDGLAKAYAGHNLPHNVEARLNTIICEQVEWIRRVALENLSYTHTDFSGRLMTACEESLNINGKLNCDKFLKYLTKEAGLCIQTASRILELMELALDEATKKPVDIPPMMSIARNYNITAPQLMKQLEKSFTDLLADFSSKSPPQFNAELELLKNQQDMDIYADVVFNQWRQVTSAFGVMLPTPHYSKQ